MPACFGVGTLMQGLGVTTTGKVILGLVNQRVLTGVFSSQVEQLQSGRAAAKGKQKTQALRIKESPPQCVLSDKR